MAERYAGSARFENSLKLYSATVLSTNGDAVLLNFGRFKALTRFVGIGKLLLSSLDAVTVIGYSLRQEWSRVQCQRSCPKDGYIRETFKAITRKRVSTGQKAGV